MRTAVRRLAAIVLALGLALPALAGPMVDRTKEAGYLFSMPRRQGAAFRRVALLVVLPGKGVSAKLERDNWAFAAEKHGFALVNLEVDYASVNNENALDALQTKIQSIVKAVIAEEPSIDADQVFLGGSSRGGMAALGIALRHPASYRGIAVASGAMLAFGEEDTESARDQHFFFVHGDQDKIVPVTYLQKTLKRLAASGAKSQAFVHKGAGHILDKSDYSQLMEWMAFRAGRRPVPSK